MQLNPHSHARRTGSSFPAASPSSPAVVIVIVVFLLLYMIFSRYTKVGPNQVLIVSGSKHKLEDGTHGRLPHRQRRRHVRHADF